MEVNREKRPGVTQVDQRHKKSIGTYVPPAKRVKSEKLDVGSEEYQRFQWDDSKKKINGLINRASPSKVAVIVKELFKFNLIRYKGLFVSAILKAQETSPVFTEVYAALIAVINSRIRTIGSLLVNRLILQFRVAFVNNNKARCLALVKFIAHLTNQSVVHEVLAFQIINLLMDKPTPSSIEIVISLIRESGAKLDELNPPALFEVFKTLRDLSLENEFDTRTHDLIDLIHVIRKEKFKNNPPVKKDLDLIDENDRETLSIELNSPRKSDFHMDFNYFKFEPDWSERESKWNELTKTWFDDDEASSTSDEEQDDDNVDEEDDKKDIKIDSKIIDATGSEIIAFRRKVFLTIRSSLTHEEVVHKLLASKIDPLLYDELCQMIVDCCGQDRTYQTIYGLIASKLCQIKRRDLAPIFEKIFQLFYETIHRYETNKIRNIAKFYAHLLTTESIDWICLSCLQLRENATSSAGRCFIKFLFQELAAILSLSTLIQYIQEPGKESAFNGLFPKDQEQDIRFSINFFSYSGLAELTEGLKQELLSRQ